MWRSNRKSLLNEERPKKEWIKKIRLAWSVYAPVKVNPEPPHPGICGALVGLYHHISSSLSSQYVGDSHVFLRLSWGMWGISRGFILIQDGGDHSHKDFWEYFSTWERTQVFTGISVIHRIVRQIYTSINLGHGFKKANALILRIANDFFVLLLRKDNFSECFNTYGMLWLKLSLN